MRVEGRGVRRSWNPPVTAVEKKRGNPACSAAILTSLPGDPCAEWVEGGEHILGGSPGTA